MKSDKELSTTPASSRMILFQRMEIKYLIDRTIRTKLARDLSALMRPDSYTCKEGSYVVRSLYYDTPDFRAYHDKVAGAAERHKLRVRVYGRDPRQSPIIRFEVKSRYVSFIHKITLDFPLEEYEEIEPVIFGRAMPPDKVLQDPYLSKEFFRIQRQYNMEPKILVQYRREAYERMEINRVRVNFDDELVASRNLELLAPLKAARSLLKYGNSIFEIKVDGGLPFWMHNLISKYNLQNRAFSKYCQSVRSEARFTAEARPAIYN